MISQMPENGVTVLTVQPDMFEFDASIHGDGGRREAHFSTR